jgi:hypothetical protein
LKALPISFVLDICFASFFAYTDLTLAKYRILSSTTQQNQVKKVYKKINSWLFKAPCLIFGIINIKLINL